MLTSEMIMLTSEMQSKLVVLKIESFLKETIEKNTARKYY